MLNSNETMKCKYILSPCYSQRDKLNLLGYGHIKRIRPDEVLKMDNISSHVLLTILCAII